MTTYRLFPSTSGPASPTSYTGPFLAGVLFEVTSGGMWFEGYYWWVASTGQSTSAQKFALWNVTGNNAGTLISGSVVTSGTLTAGAWNYVPLTTPIPLALGTTYNACTGFSNSFPDTHDTYLTTGITNGPLSAFSDLGGSSPEQWGNPQGVFSASLGTDPSVHAPFQGSDSANFWMDLSVSDTAPASYSGTYRLWPNNITADSGTQIDSAVNYVVATEFHLSQPCTVSNIWYYSPSGTAQLATACDIWSIDSQSSVAGTASPSWSGAAGSGWVSCPVSATLAAGKYKVSVYNGAATPDGWSAKRLGYWGVDGAAVPIGINGITNGPLYAPNTANASEADIYQGEGQEPGQSIFAVGPPDQYPNLYVDALFQNYWIDLEVAPIPVTATSSIIPVLMNAGM
jgi:hypothetical protein